MCPFKLCDGLIAVQIWVCPDVFIEGISWDKIDEDKWSDYVLRDSSQSSLLFP
jgi:hypothetical protein